MAGADGETDMTKGGVSSSGGDRRGGGGGDDTLQVAQLKERHHELDIDGGRLVGDIKTYQRKRGWKSRILVYCIPTRLLRGGC